MPETKATDKILQISSIRNRVVQVTIRIHISCIEHFGIEQMLMDLSRREMVDIAFGIIVPLISLAWPC